MVDDGIGGYMDTGVDDFEEAEDREESDDERPNRRGVSLEFLCSNCPSVTVSKHQLRRESRMRREKRKPSPSLHLLQ